TLDKLKFKHKFSHKITELKIKNKIYHDLTLKIAYETVQIQNSQGVSSEVTYISSKLLNKDKTPVFKNDSFVLATNKIISSDEDAYQAYLNYFIRWKIESVFKFLKTTLGLEKFRVPAMSAIKNMIALVFLVGAYLLNLGEVEIDESYIKHLAYLGCGKGKVTPYYIRQGFAVFVHYLEAKEFLDSLPPREAEELLEKVKKSLISRRQG
ncbi:MAG: transposase, partial [Patescibacteria group bacterium]